MSISGSPKLSGKNSPERNSHTDDVYSNCIRSYLNENRNLRDQIKQMNNEIVQQKEETMKVSSELQRARENASPLESTIYQLKRQIYELQETNQSIVEEANSRISRLNAELQVARQENTELRAKLASYQKANSDFAVSHESDVRTIDQLNIKFRRINEQVRLANDTIKAMSERESQTNSKNSQLQQKCNDYMDQCAKLQAQLAASQRKMKEQSSMVDELQYRVSSLEELSRKTRSLSSIIEEKDTLIQTLKETVNKTDIKCQSLTEALKHAQQQVEQSLIHEAETQTLRDQHDALVKRAEDAEQAARRYESELLEKSAQYTETIVKQNANISRLTAKLDEAQKSIRTTQTEKDRFRLEAQEARSIAEQVEKVYNEIKMKCDSITMKVNDLSSSFSQSPKKIDDLEPALPHQSPRRTVIPSPKRFTDYRTYTMPFNADEDEEENDYLDDAFKHKLLYPESD